MKKYRMAIVFALLMWSNHALCQGTQAVEMADVMRSDGKIYTVVFGLVVILTGLIFFVWRVDRKVSRLEKEQRAKTKEYSAND